MGGPGDEVPLVCPLHHTQEADRALIEVSRVDQKLPGVHWGCHALTVPRTGQPQASHRSVSVDRTLWQVLLEEVSITPAVMGRAIEVQRALAAVGRHRVPIPDLIIAAAAESADLAVLHYDADYETIARVTGQPHRWVVPRGSV